MSRLAYRSRQFWNALFNPVRRIPSVSLLPALTPELLVLFRRMQPAEQSHAYRIFTGLQSDGYTDLDLLTAALLHDVGKTLLPLSIIDRVVIVVASRIFPRASGGWGDGKPAGLRRPFVIAARHAGWGADLAAQAGASPRTVELIRRHHDPRKTDGSGLSNSPDLLLAALQDMDGKN